MSDSSDIRDGRVHWLWMRYNSGMLRWLDECDRVSINSVLYTIQCSYIYPDISLA